MDILYYIFIYPLEYLMEVCFIYSYKHTNSYGYSILILSVVVNIALLPLYYLAEKWRLQEKNIKQNMEGELSSIKKYSSKREKYYYTQEVYKRFGYHPISAVKVSFGFLIQIPFFFSAYVLLSNFPGWEGAGFLIISDLSVPDELIHISGITINLLPILMTVINLASAYIYTTYMSRSEKIQLWLLAFIFLVVLYNSPAGLVLYWTLNNVFSLVKNMVGQRLHFDFLTFREEKNNIGTLSGFDTILTRLGLFRDSVIKLIKLPAIFNFVLFLFAIFTLLVHEAIKTKTYQTAMIMFSVGIVVLLYLCLVHLLETFRSTKHRRSIQQKLYTTLVQILFASFVITTAIWLFSTEQLLYMKKIIVVNLLFLLVIIYSPLILGRALILKRMPNLHWLYAIATIVTAFILCIANPLNLYTSSVDFSGEIYGVVNILLVYFFVVLLFATALYVLVDEKSKKGLTLLSVFSAVCVVIYSNVLNVGLMDHFILNHPHQLILTTYEILVEISILVFLFAATVFATIYYRQLVVYVMGAVLATSVFMVAAATYGATNVIVEAPEYELPDDNHEIIGFSREKNVLIIMLDGFSGGYIEKIKNDAPETLKEYDGFVWYPNMLTTNSGTWGSIGPMYGGHKYVVEEINSRNEPSLEHAIAQAHTVYPDAFIPKGYEITYVKSQSLYSNKCANMDVRVHCTETTPYGMYYHNKHADTSLNHEAINIPRMLIMISLFKASPYILKSQIYDRGNWLGANANKSVSSHLFKLPEWGFLNALAHESNADSKSKTFKFIHLQVPHAPYALDEDCRLQLKSSNYFAESVCVLKEIGVLLTRLKQFGIYNNTKIVLVSDHGWWVDNPMFPSDFSKTVPEGYNRRASPGFVHSLLLVKDFGAKGEMGLSDTFLSNADIPSIVCSVIGSCKDVRPDPIKNSIKDRILTLFITDDPAKYDKTNKFIVKERYEVKNNIFEARNWKKIK